MQIPCAFVWVRFLFGATALMRPQAPDTSTRPRWPVPAADAAVRMPRVGPTRSTPRVAYFSILFLPLI